MKYKFLPSFERSAKTLTKDERNKISDVVIEVIEVFSTKKSPSKGLGLTKLRENYWEAYRGLKTRILFRLKKDLIEFILAGNHDNVKRFLKKV